MNAQRAFAFVAASALLSFGPALHRQDPGPLDAPKLKDMIVGLGYAVRALNETAGKEKYEFTVKTPEFDVPVAAELSGSKNYVWLTVFLGAAPKADSPKCLSYLQRNFKIQPSQFYVTDKGNLMLGIVVDNRGIDSNVLRRVITKLSEDAVSTADLWNAGTGGERARAE